MLPMTTRLQVVFFAPVPFLCGTTYNAYMKTTEAEIWKEVEYKGIAYIVSDMGAVKTPARPHTYTRVRNGKRQQITRTRAPQHYTPQQHHTGYREIGLRQNGIKVRVMVHRLIALAFVPGYARGLTVNHINGVKHDNRASNLEWVSFARNTQHAWETGLVNLNGENQPTAKLTSKRVAYIRKLLHLGINAHTIAIVAGMSDTVIYLIRDGKRWKQDL